MGRCTNCNSRPANSAHHQDICCVCYVLLFTEASHTESHKKYESQRQWQLDTIKSAFARLKLEVDMFGPSVGLSIEEVRTMLDGIEQHRQRIMLL